MITYNLTYHYDNNANLHDYRLYVFVPAPLLYISLPCSCPMYFLYQLLILFFSSTNKGGIILFLGLSVPEEVPWCSASTLALLTSFLNSGQSHPTSLDTVPPQRIFFQLFSCLQLPN